MPRPKISAKGLAEFLNASPARRRSIARNYKFPSEGEGVGRAVYYSAALSAIRSFHRSQGNPGVFADSIQALELKLKEFTGKKDRLKKARAENNIRAIQMYARQFGQAKYNLLPSPRLRYEIGNVVITATPDLLVETRRKQFLIKLDLGKKGLKPEVIDFLLYVFYQAVLAARLPIESQRILYLEASTGREYACPTNSSLLRRRLKSATEAYADVWSTIPE